MELEWHKFTKNTMPIGERNILVCRDFGKEWAFFVVVKWIEGKYGVYNCFGLVEFVPETRDRWTYIPMPEK